MASSMRPLEPRRADLHFESGSVISAGWPFAPVRSLWRPRSSVSAQSSHAYRVLAKKSLSAPQRDRSSRVSEGFCPEEPPRDLAALHALALLPSAFPQPVRSHALCGSSSRVCAHDVLLDTADPVLPRYSRVTCRNSGYPSKDGLSGRRSREALPHPLHQSPNRNRTSVLEWAGGVIFSPRHGEWATLSLVPTWNSTHPRGREYSLMTRAGIILFIMLPEM